MELKHSFELYEFYRLKVAECDTAIEALLKKQIEDNERKDGEVRPKLERTERKKQNKNRPNMDIERLAFQLTGGIDLSKIDCVRADAAFDHFGDRHRGGQVLSSQTVCLIVTFDTEQQKTGGKVMSSHTPKRKNRLSLAIQPAANVIGNNLKDGALHQFFTRIKIKKGYKEAVVATAQKLAVIIWNMLAPKEQYQPTEDAACTEKIKAQTIKNMQKKLKN